MTVDYWTYGSRDGHRDVSTVGSALDLVQLLDGSPRSSSWDPIGVTLESVASKKRYTDFMALAVFAPVVTANAVNEMSSVFESVVELLPVQSGSDEELLIVHVPIVAGALDLERSAITRFSFGDIMSVDHAVFNDDVVSGLTMFRVAEAPVGRVYVTSRFRDALQQAPDVVGPALLDLSGGVGRP